MEEKHINMDVVAPFFELGNEQNNKLVYVVHGYGQLAKYFIQKFKKLQDLGYVVIAPEGLHRFYLEGTSGRVGASWMTKENRNLDIQNYISYLDTLHATIKKRKQWDSIEVLGFSQGVATAFRWIANGNIHPTKFLMCSGMIPPDVDLHAKNNVFNDISLSYFSGTNDPYKTEAAVLAFQDKIKDSNLSIKAHEFEGTHEVNIEAILEYLRFN